MRRTGVYHCNTRLRLLDAVVKNAVQKATCVRIRVLGFPGEAAGSWYCSWGGRRGGGSVHHAAHGVLRWRSAEAEKCHFLPLRGKLSSVASAFPASKHIG